eukprot:COSAG04_NODE_188_length_20978_cov_7.733225_8_plen_212_part_00
MVGRSGAKRISTAPRKSKSTASTPALPLNLRSTECIGMEWPERFELWSYWCLRRRWLRSGLSRDRAWCGLHSSCQAPPSPSPRRGLRRSSSHSPAMTVRSARSSLQTVAQAHSSRPRIIALRELKTRPGLTALRVRLCVPALQWVSCVARRHSTGTSPPSWSAASSTPTACCQRLSGCPSKGALHSFAALSGRPGSLCGAFVRCCVLAFRL